VAQAGWLGPKVGGRLVPCYSMAATVAWRQAATDLGEPSELLQLICKYCPGYYYYYFFDIF